MNPKPYLKISMVSLILLFLAGAALAALSVTMRLAPGNTCPTQVQTFNEGVLTPDSTCGITVTNDQDLQRLLRQGWVVSTLPTMNGPLTLHSSYLRVGPAVHIAALPSCVPAIAGAYMEVDNGVACTAGATPVATATAFVPQGVHCSGSTWNCIP